MDISHGIPFASPMKIYAGDYDDVADDLDREECYNLKILIRPSAYDNLLLYVSGYTAVTLDLFLSSF